MPRTIRPRRRTFAVACTSWRSGWRWPSIARASHRTICTARCPRSPSRSSSCSTRRVTTRSPWAISEVRPDCLQLRAGNRQGAGRGVAGRSASPSSVGRRWRSTANIATSRTEVEEARRRDQGPRRRPGGGRARRLRAAGSSTSPLIVRDHRRDRLCASRRRRTGAQQKCSRTSARQPQGPSGRHPDLGHCRKPLRHRGPGQGREQYVPAPRPGRRRLRLRQDRAAARSTRSG